LGSARRNCPSGKVRRTESMGIDESNPALSAINRASSSWSFFVS
jgi:hypothetical protein